MRRCEFPSDDLTIPGQRPRSAGPIHRNLPRIAEPDSWRTRSDSWVSPVDYATAAAISREAHVPKSALIVVLAILIQQCRYNCATSMQA